MKDLVKTRLKFEEYCKLNFGMLSKNFKMVPWEWAGNKSTFGKTYTNNVTEGMWKLWLKLKTEEK